MNEYSRAMIKYYYKEYILYLI